MCFSVTRGPSLQRWSSQVSLSPSSPAAVRYDIKDWDTVSVDSGPSATAPAFGVAPFCVTVPAQTVTVRKHYDPQGNVDTLARRTDPDTNHVGWIATKWRYDVADRKVAEVAPDGWVDSTAYDPAGNAVAVVTRRGHVIPMTYDALNRLTRRIVPSSVYPDTITCGPGGFNPCPGRFPMYHFGPGGGLTVPADTATFAYDSVGNMRRADNRWARIARRYNRNGTLAADTLRIAAYGQFTTPGDTTTHVNGLRYGYDLDGRRTWLKHPGSVAPIDTGVVRDSAAYGYDAAGRLATVRDIEGNVFQYAYDLDGTTMPMGGLSDASRSGPARRALGAAREEFDAGPLVHLFERSDSPTLRWAIANTLAETRPAGLRDWLIRALQDRHYGKAREMLALAAARTNPPEVVNRVLVRLLDELPGHAALALAETGGPRELDALRRAYAGATGWEREQIGRTINMIERRDEERR